MLSTENCPGTLNQSKMTIVMGLKSTWSTFEAFKAIRVTNYGKDYLKLFMIMDCTDI